MMRLAHDAVARHAQAPAMLYVSIDQARTCSKDLEIFQGFEELT